MINQESENNVLPGAEAPVEQAPTAESVKPSLPGVRDLLSEAWGIYIQRLNTYVGIMIIPTVAMLAVILVLLSFLAGGAFLSLVGSSVDTTSGQAIVDAVTKTATGHAVPLIGLGIIFFAIMLLIQTWGHLSLLYAIKDREENIDIKESYRRGWQKIASSWWVSLLTLLAFMGGLLLFIVPGIIFVIWFSLAIFVLVNENIIGTKALSKSKEYIKGKWWSVFWRFVFIGIVSSVFSMILSAVFSKMPLGQQVINFASSLVMTPLTVIYTFLLYLKLKAIKESTI
jgi:hypothetical protein